MRRTTSRSSSRSGGRRASASRSKRSKRAARPRLSSLQVREILGVLFLLAALLGLLGILSHADSILGTIRDGMLAAFGVAWFVPVGAAVALGAYLLWPKAPRPRTIDVLAGVVAVASLVGLFGLAAHAGGVVGRNIDDALATPFTQVGAWGLLIAGLVIGLIVTVHFSPGALLVSAVGALRAANAEGARMRELVAGTATEKPKTPKPLPATADVLTRSAASFATAPAPKVQPREWEVDEPEPEPAEEPRRVEETAEPVSPAHTPVMRVVAEPEDELPEIDWKLPAIALLDTVTARRERMADEIKRNVKVIESTLEQFGVEAKIIGVNPGPAVTQYEVQPGPGVQVKRITALQNDLSLALAAAPLRIEAPIPGKSAVGIEVPNKSASLVTIREVIETAAFREGSNKLALGLGNDVSGQSIVADLTRMPHLLIAGATGQGKSVCINALITSLLFQATPDHLRMLLIDPKRVELTGYNGLPHLALPVLVESHQAAAALRWAVAEMDRRYKLFSSEGVRNIAGYNDRAAQKLARPLPYVVIVIDELADLMMVAAGEMEELICRIAQLARAVGIHLIIATQRPSTDIITGLIKANIPSRIAFAVGSQVDSRVILDAGGAEKLLGRGDMLYQPVDAGKPTRIQGAFVSDQEVEGVVNFWKSQGGPRYMEEILEEGAVSEWDGERREERKLDPLFARSARAVAAEGAASVSLVQRKFNVGYSRAGRIVDQLADHRVIGGYQGSKSREVLMTLPDVDELLERLGIE
ncbi:MAG TPA: DNA translocase FtsK 4TM domain-containing protein [Candidatus Dormibacteraeota bacterium]|nr:DNA translocase FtsK 4TM domain-containing protein [Candidatus Dormibacteraeota bacterium]